MAALLGVVFTAELLAQTTAFTYQGRLQSDGTAYSGPAEFQFTLWDAAEEGTQLSATTPETLSGAVSGGLFTLVLDFGDGPFTGGEDRWLEIELRTGLGEFEVLTPRQKINTTPYALTAANVSGPVPAEQLDGALPSANLAGTYSSAITLNNTGNSFSGDGAGLTGLNASELTEGIVPDDRLPGDVARTDQVWLLGGNAGTTAGTRFIGTTDNQPLEFKVNDARALRLEFHTNHAEVGSPSPNVISGHADNEVAPGVSGATIAGGGGTNWWGPTLPQRVSGAFSTIGGGIGNTVEAEVGVIAGGERGFIGSNAFNAFIGGGAWNTNLSSDATIGGGRFNLIPVNANNATVGGGGFNTASGADSVVPGGRDNTAAGVSSFAAGRNATANHRGAFVWADSDDGGFASIQTDEFAIRARNGVRIHNQGNGATLLRLETERPWEFRQRGSGASSALELVSLDSSGVANKHFIINTTGGGSVGIGTTAPGFTLHVNGSAGKPGGGSWSSASDARLKEMRQPFTRGLAALDLLS
jgi:hypothetical protein